MANIQKATQNFVWKHVRSNENPADLSSRGISVEELKSSNLWWHGAPFLLEKDQTWPIQPTVNSKKILETKTVLLVKGVEENFQFKNSCSKFKTFLKAIILIIRWADKIKTKSPKLNLEPYKAEEFRDAEQRVIKILQKNSYKNELKQVTARKPLAHDSQIKNLTPIIIDGVLRVGGRLINSNLDFDALFSQEITLLK